MGLARFIYSLGTSLVVWTALVPYVVVQIARGRATWADLRERLGDVLDRGERPNVRVIVHAVSAGELMAAAGLMEALGRERPDWRFVISCGTEDARRIARAVRPRLPGIDAIVLWPWDRRVAAARWLRTLRPDALIVVEPEIWPNLYRECDRAGVPLILVNAHMYPRDLRRYRWIRPLIADALSAPRWIAVQSARDRDAFVALGAPAPCIDVTGSLKFDAAPRSTASGVQRPPSALTIVGGSVHDLEAEWLLDHVVRLRPRYATLRAIVAPRYVERVESVMTAARRRGLGAARLSTDAAAEPDVLVVDRFGDLASMYGAADVAFVGGSLVERGGHNVLEPASHGRAIVVGPHVDHIRDVVAGLEAEGAIVRLEQATSAALGDALDRLLADAELRRALGDRARRFHAARSGAAARCAARIIAEIESRATPATSPRAASAAACCTPAATPLADR